MLTWQAINLPLGLSRPLPYSAWSRIESKAFAFFCTAQGGRERSDSQLKQCTMDCLPSKQAIFKGIQPV